MRTKSDIQRVLTDYLIPWAREVETRWFVATDRKAALQLCSGVKMTPTESAGEGRALTKRSYRNVADFNREWPQRRLHSSTNPKIGCVIAGHADLEFWDYDLQIPTGTFFLVPPDVPNTNGLFSHIKENNPSDACEVLWMEQKGEELHVWICYSRGEEHGSYQRNNILILSQQLNLFLRLLHEEAIGRPHSKISLIPQLLLLLITGLQRELHLENYLPSGRGAGVSFEFRSSLDPIAQAKDFIDTHYNKRQLTLEQVAREVAMSRSLFAKEFKRKTGITMGKYLTHRRLQKAKDLLHRSEWSVNQISRFVGFTSPNYFYRLFRQHEYCSPAEYREKRGSIEKNNHK